MAEQKKERVKRQKKQTISNINNFQLKTESKSIGIYDENGRLIGLKI